MQQEQHLSLLYAVQKHYAYSKFNNFAQTLGLLKEPADIINDVKTFSFSDDKGHDFYFSPVNLLKNRITLRRINVNPNHTGEDVRLDFTSCDIGL